MHTAKRARADLAMVTSSPSGTAFASTPSDPVGLVPMKLGSPDSSVRQADRSDPLHFAPATRPIHLAKARQFPNRATSRDGLETRRRNWPPSPGRCSRYQAWAASRSSSASAVSRRRFTSAAQACSEPAATISPRRGCAHAHADASRAPFAVRQSPGSPRGLRRGYPIPPRAAGAGPRH